MNSKPLVSVIMPAFNAERYITKAVASVIHQLYKNWELIIVNDGSTDNTDQVVRNFSDARIRYFKQKNKGVASARNLGLNHMKGSYFCFLDADDLMTEHSLSSRLEVFANNSKLDFVGGAQMQKNATLEKVLTVQYPNFRGNPKRELIKMNEGCFINCGTWLIKRNNSKQYSFQEGWSHCEDLLFFLSIADDGELDYTREVVQVYRRSVGTAMDNLDGLAKSYKDFYKYVKSLNDVSSFDVMYLRYRIRRIMFLSYLRNKEFKKALKFVLSN